MSNGASEAQLAKETEQCHMLGDCTGPRDTGPRETKRWKLIIYEGIFDYWFEFLGDFPLSIKVCVSKLAHISV